MDDDILKDFARQLSGATNLPLRQSIKLLGELDAAMRPAQSKRYNVSVGLAIGGALLFCLPEAILPRHIIVALAMNSANVPAWAKIWTWAVVISTYLGAFLMGAAVGNCMRHWLLGAIAGILVLVACGVFLRVCLTPAIIHGLLSP